MALVSITRPIAGLARIGMALLGLAAMFSAVSTAAAASSPLAGRQVSGFAELLLQTGASEPAEDAALTVALATYEQGGEPQVVAPLQAFLAAYPRSPWRVALLTNLGLVHYHYG